MTHGSQHLHEKNNWCVFYQQLVQANISDNSNTTEQVHQYIVPQDNNKLDKKIPSAL